MRNLLVLVAAVLVLAGCGERTASNDPAPAGQADSGGARLESLQGRTFVLESAIEKGAPLGIVSGTTIELRFTDDGRLVANAGCNTMTGTAAMSGDRLDTDLGVTEMACDEPRHAQDEWLSTLLTGNPTLRVDGDRMTISSPDAELVLARQQDEPLQGTTWTVSSLLDAQSAGSATTEATLEFGDGEVAITGLCNLKSVAYRESGPTLTFELGMLTRMACAPEIMTVENAAVQVLDGEATYEVDGRTLTITNGDHALQLTAG
jgi:heat shock protein HslJ